MQGYRSRGDTAPPPPPRLPQFLADQLTLSQPGGRGGGADYAHRITSCPRIFKPSYGPALLQLRSLAVTMRSLSMPSFRTLIEFVAPNMLFKSLVVEVSIWM